MAASRTSRWKSERAASEYSTACGWRRAARQPSAAARTARVAIPCAARRPRAAAGNRCWRYTHTGPPGESRLQARRAPRRNECIGPGPCAMPGRSRLSVQRRRIDRHRFLVAAFVDELSQRGAGHRGVEPCQCFGRGPTRRHLQAGIANHFNQAAVDGGVCRAGQHDGRVGRNHRIVRRQKLCEIGSLALGKRGQFVDAGVLPMKFRKIVGVGLRDRDSPSLLL